LIRFNRKTSPTLGLANTRACQSEQLAKRHPLDTIITMNLLDRITVEQGKCGGKPCIRGYRLRVSDVLALIAAGASHEEMLNDYPFLESEDIVAALTYAAQQLDHTIIAGGA
jgi:uncharacterized protein (DUF433 family)